MALGFTFRSGRRFAGRPTNPANGGRSSFAN